MSSVIQRSATNQSITPEYASGLSAAELLDEIQAIDDILKGESETGVFEDALRDNRQILWREYLKGDANAGSRTLEQFQEGAPCYDRNTQPWTMVVDAHLHYEPFGGPSVATSDLYDFIRRAEVLFTTAYGIGQVLPASSGCIHYLDCPGVPVRPSMKNDLINVLNLRNFDTKGVQTIISRTFPDPANPEHVMWKTRILDLVFPDTFKGMGEINVVKLALSENWNSPTPVWKIAEWADFMEFLRLRNMPIALHSDLGSDAGPPVDVEPIPLAPRRMDPYVDECKGHACHSDYGPGSPGRWPQEIPPLYDFSEPFPQAPWRMDPRVDECKGHACHSDYGRGAQGRWPQVTPRPYDFVFPDDASVKAKQTEYLYLMEEVLRQYPDNKIIWMHMGLSKELVKIDPEFHIQIMTRLLEAYSNLMLDISWRVLFDNYFDPKKHPEKRKKYLNFFNRYSARIIVGTDFVANKTKRFRDYQELVRVNSDILRDLNPKAFRNIALGENYFRLYSLPFTAPDICADPMNKDAVLEWTDKEMSGVSRK